MREGWVESTLGEVAAEVTEKFDPSAATPAFYVGLEHLDSGVPVLSRRGDSASVVSLKTRFREGDVLFGKLRPYLRKSAPAPFDGVCSTDILVFRAQTEAITPGYLALVLQHTKTFEHAERSSAGTRMPRTSAKAMKSLVVPLPPLVEQGRIVDLISSIDQAIQAADSVREAAFEASRAILKQAFSKEEGRPSTLGDIATFLNGYPFKPAELGSRGLPVIRIKQLLNVNEVPDRSLVEVPDKHLLKNGDLIFSWSGTLATRFWNRGPAILNQHLFKVVEKGGVDRSWLRLALEHAIEELETMTHGTTMKHITKAKMMPHPVVVPPIKLQRQLASRYEALEQTAERASSVVERLTSLRTDLLSSLLSGVHEIPDSYDRFLEEAS